jgi:toxin ParE1/3/4
MPKATYSPEAKDDLRQITRYIARDNLSAATMWLDTAHATCDLLATQPGIGQPVHSKRFGEARRHVLGNYLIYYVPASHEIEVVRVLHAARDQDKLL